MYLLRRTAQTRKHRAFTALLDHQVFKDLQENEQSAAGESLAGSLDDFHATDCNVRLGEGWKSEFEGLNPMNVWFPRRSARVSWRSPLILHKSELHEDVSHLLEKLSTVDDIDSSSHSKLRTALVEYLAQDRPTNSASQNTEAVMT